MAEDFEIELLDEEKEEETSFQLPMNFIVVGEVANDDVDVYIKQDVFKKLEAYSETDLEHELGSILVGEYTEVMGKTSVVISDFIKAKYTDASASTLTFTHETWDYVHKVHEEKFADKKILGWQHTHPGYGIFLSNYDMFIQENFFNLPFQVAYVIDPKQGTRGFFQWKNNEVQKLKGFYVYDEVGKNVKVDLSKKETKEAEKGKPTKSLPSYITIVLAVAVVILSALVLKLNGQVKNQVYDYDQLKSIVAQQSSEIAYLKILNNPSSSTNDKEDVSFKKYTVKEGDSIYKICESNKLDYAENLEIIKSVNGLESADSLKVGQVILIPCYN